MILLDTHALVWFVNADKKLPRELQEKISSLKNEGLGVSIISFWEIAMLIEHKRIDFNKALDEWVSKVLGLPYIELLPLTPEIALDSNRLPQPFHKDPADRIIVATARSLDIPVATIDRRIIDYPFVKKI
jgi:PIN domain nuclease of toxin-antitoxin system